MERKSLTPKELEDKTVVDASGRLLGRVRRVAFDPGVGVEGFDVEVDGETRARYAPVGPYVELLPEEVTEVGAGEVVVAPDLEELLGRAGERGRPGSGAGHPAHDRPEGPGRPDTGAVHTLDVGEDSTVGLAVVGEPAVDPDWDDEDDA